jgi:two-component system KDP operon response regulator KdpE
MQRKVQVLLLGTHAMILSAFRRHSHEYLIKHLEGINLSVAIRDEPKPELLVLLRDDLHLCQQVRRMWPMLPLVIVSENSSERHITNALDMGADDYITIPFGENEFFARIRALMRRMLIYTSGDMHHDADILTSQDGKLVLRIDAHQCLFAGQPVRLTVKEFKLLRVLMEYQEKLLTHRFLLQRVWGPEYGEECDYVRVYMRQLRRKIEPDPSIPQYIVTEAGGYVFRGSLEGEKV